MNTHTHTALYFSLYFQSSDRIILKQKLSGRGHKVDGPQPRGHTINSARTRNFVQLATSRRKERAVETRNIA